MQANKLQIEKIIINNFKVFYNSEIEIKKRLFVLIGKNGCGKSTFFKVFEFLKMALHSDINQALTNLGGYKKVVTRGHENENIKITIKFRSFSKGEDKSPLVTYILEIKPDHNDGGIIEQEILEYRRGSRGKPWRFIEFKSGKGNVVINEDEYENLQSEVKREEDELENNYTMALKRFAGSKKYKIINSFYELLSKWQVYDLQNKQMQEASNSTDTKKLLKDGNNLPRYTAYIEKEHPKTFDKIKQIFSNNLIGVNGVKTESIHGKTFLNFYDSSMGDKGEFIASEVSDGTIKLFAYLSLLNDPEPSPLICIEEPENYLYPDLLKILANELRKYANTGDGQVFVSTHDSEFLEQITIDEAFLVNKKEGISNIQALNTFEKIKELYQHGTTLGWLWWAGELENLQSEQ